MKTLNHSLINTIESHKNWYQREEDLDLHTLLSSLDLKLLLDGVVHQQAEERSSAMRRDLNTRNMVESELEVA